MCSNFRSYLQIKFSSQSCGFNWKYWCPAFLSFQHLSFLIYKTENKTYSWLELFNLDNFCQEFLTYFCFTRTRSCRFKNSFPISDIENASYWMKQFKMLSGNSLDIVACLTSPWWVCLPSTVYSGRKYSLTEPIIWPVLCSGHVIITLSLKFTCYWLANISNVPKWKN